MALHQKASLAVTLSHLLWLATIVGCAPSGVASRRVMANDGCSLTLIDEVRIVTNGVDDCDPRYRRPNDLCVGAYGDHYDG